MSTLKGQGTYVLRNGKSGVDKLTFSTREKSKLFVGGWPGGTRYEATEVQSFTIDGHTLLPAGNFDYYMGTTGLGGHEYHAENAFIEYIDTTGYLQLALFRTAEPMGSSGMASFAIYLLRRRGDKEFVQGPDNFQAWAKDYRLELAEELKPWPELQQAVRSGTANFRTFPTYIRRANEQAR
ncbi:hypothetical protein [Solirubrum puertoriconensis]|uniref:hypothetical protein n=1 Tax=Solirubrum puertoriconensis TaxID=1751427 RepID=UPI00122DC663|nr:hypothetical protein [Solirubrum puertoriconensis]